MIIKNLLFKLKKSPYLSFISPVFASEDSGEGGGSGGNTGEQSLGKLKGFGGYVPKEGSNGAPVGQMITKIFSNMFGVMTIIGGIMFFIYFLLGALEWITSSGKPDKVQKAKDKMVSAAIGAIAVVATYGVSVIIGQILGINILNPAQYIEDFWKTK